MFWFIKREISPKSETEPCSWLIWHVSPSQYGTRLLLVLKKKPMYKFAIHLFTDFGSIWSCNLDGWVGTKIEIELNLLLVSKFCQFKLNWIFLVNQYIKAYRGSLRSNPADPARDIVSRPFFIFVPLPLFIFVFCFCRGDAVAMMNNNTPSFGMTAKSSRPKWRKIDNNRECLKALPEV